MTSETVSVVFTDLVGSTEILSRLGETRGEMLRREFFALLREGADAHGGREVKNLGDGLMLVFPSASDAVAGAVTIQQLAEVFNRTSAEPLLIRAGGATGDADVADDDYFGVSVVEAARLCGLAEGGQILVTESMRMLARARGGHEFSALGALELKGLDEPVPTCAVVWEPLEVEEPRVPLPGRVEANALGSFVGRAAELSLLHDAVKNADASRRRRVVLLSGEAGVGKTTLISEFVRTAHERGAVVLYGRCDEDVTVPYQPWVEGLAHLVAHATDETLSAHVEARGGDLAPLLPGLARRVAVAPAVRSDDPETARYLLFGSVVDLLARAGEGAPIVLVLDDLHWADRTTVQLLRHIAAADEDLRLVLVGTFRDSDIDASHPLTETLAALHREPGAERVTLGGLDDLELVALMEAVAGHDLDADGLELRDALRRETGGNPFFVTEMLRHLAESGALVQGDDGRWRASAELRDIGLPVSVREVIGRRVANLSAEAQKVLTAAAVIGRDFDLDLLGAVAETDEDALLDVLDEATGVAVVAEVAGHADRYSFVHVLIQRTLYDGLSAARRRRLHRRVGEALETAPGDVGDRVSELARHWYEATQPADVEKAFAYALQAGDRAQQQLAPDEAVRWYTQALDLADRVPDSEAQRTECLVRLGTAQRLDGSPDYRETLLEGARLAEERGDTDRLSRAALANFRGFFSRVGGVDPDRIRVLEVALTAVGDQPSGLRVRLLARLATESIFDPTRETARMLDEAIEMSAGTSDIESRLDALFALGTYYVADNLEQRLALLPEVERLVGRADPGRRFWSGVSAVIALVQSGRIDDAWRCAERLRVQAAEIGDPTVVWAATFAYGMLVLLSGDIVEARRLAQAGLEIGFGAGQPDTMTISGGQLAFVAYVEGKDEELFPLLEAALAAGDETLIVRGAHTWALTLLGRDDEARVTCDRFAAEGADRPVEPLFPAALPVFVYAAAYLRHEVLLRQLLVYLEPVRRQLVCTGATVDAHGALWIAIVHAALEEWELAEADFTEALALTESLGAPYFIANTRSWWAEMLVRRGDPADRGRARELAEAAIDPARQLGFGRIERSCDAILAELSEGDR